MKTLHCSKYCKEIILPVLYSSSCYNLLRYFFPPISFLSQLRILRIQQVYTSLIPKHLKLIL